MSVLNKKIILFATCVFLLSSLVYSQNILNEKKVTVLVSNIEIKIDSLSIIPTSFNITYASNELAVDDSLYKIDFYTSTIVFHENLINQKLNIRYRTFPIDLSLSYTTLDTNKYVKKTDSILNIEYFSYPLDFYQPKKFDGIISTGNISRGITVGNNQSASLQSNLDIRLSGNITEDIEIQAVITDNTLPLQAEGYTYQLQEFDKVFIRLKKDKTILTAGDFEVQAPSNYFLKYNKKSKGALLSHSWISTKNKSDTATNNVSFSYGISKGKYARNVFRGVDGNQGPYKLTGNNNEMFIVVLSGTERVYVNEELLQRGYDNDYVIDYNLAELRFTNKRIISSESRIVVEFEYSDKNFARNLITSSYSFSNSKTNYYVNVFMENDLKNQPLQQTLNDNDINKLSIAGDDQSKWFESAIDSLAFNSDFVMYAMVDTVGFDSVLVYSTNPLVANYRAFFTFVGKGKGNYRLSRSIANGRVFEWVQPINNIPQGEYEPIKVLIPPNKHNQVSAGINHKINDNLDFGIELSLSNRDINTFSNIDNKDNTGTATKIYIQHISNLNKLKKPLSLRKMLSYEFTELNFSSVERFRNVDFDRNWNLENKPLLSNLHIFSNTLALEQEKIQIVNLKTDVVFSTNLITGLKNTLTTNLKFNRFSIKTNSFIMNSEKNNYRTNFIKNKATLLYQTSIFNPGVNLESEHNTFLIGNDSIMPNSYNYTEIEPFIVNSKNSNINYRLYYKYRVNSIASFNNMKNSYNSSESGLMLSTNETKENRFAFLVALRETNIKDSTLTDLKSDQQIVSRFDKSINLLNGAINSTLYLEAGSGQETKKEFSYLEVLPGQGSYIWTDYNNNNVKELDEFELAIYQQEANYVRILLPVNQFIRVNTLRFSENLIIDPRKYLKDSSSKLAKFVSEFSNRLNYSLERKIESGNFIERFVPFNNLVEDTNLISGSSIFRNVVSFRRGNPIFSAWHTFTNNQTTSLMINGNDTRQNERSEFRYIWNFKREIGTEGMFASGAVKNNSEFLLNRNHQINFIELEQKIHFFPTNNKRLTMSARYKKRENTIGLLGEKSTIFSLGPELRIPIKQGQILNLRFLYHNINFNATTNTPIAFEMLEGLNTGSNFTWNANIQANLINNLQLSLIYEGRKSENQKVRHFASVQLRALL